MPQNYFLTGLPKAGKTTVLWKLVKELKKDGIKVGGFVSPEETHHGTRNAFHVVDIDSGKEGMLADVKGDGPKVGKYHVDLRSFESVVLPAMNSCKKYDVFFIDEIGSMEMKSKKFAEALDSVLESHVPLIASLNSKYEGKFAALGEVVEVKPRTREIVHKKLLKAGKSLKVDKMPERKKKVSKKKVRKSLKKKPTKRPPTMPKEEKREEPMPEKMEEKPVKMEKPKKKGFFGKIKDLFGL